MVQDDGMVKEIERVSRGSTEVRESKPYVGLRGSINLQELTHPINKQSNHGSNHNFSPKRVPK